jgi:hypothetical protein
MSHSLSQPVAQGSQSKMRGNPPRRIYRWPLISCLGSRFAPPRLCGIALKITAFLQIPFDNTSSSVTLYL